jgi:tetratricopeptide (TPR) repeat protein
MSNCAGDSATITLMSRCFVLLLLLIFLVSWVAAQQDSQGASKQNNPPANQPPPRSDRDKEAGESSSRDTRIDIAPPKDDAKTHPNSSIPEDVDDNAGDVSEFHPWDPHKALKDIEVGDYYFKRKNYRAALDRYKEALYYKQNDAVATFRMAQCQEKLGQPEEALGNYESYLKILPHGALAEEAEKSIARLKARDEGKRAEKK